MKNLLVKKPSKLKLIIKRWKLWFSVAIIVSVIVYIMVLGTLQFARQLFTFSLADSSIAHAQVAGESAKLKPIPTRHQMIKEYINSVFGTDAPKAMLLLSCENKGLNPLAVNDNTTWGGVGQDIGIFQINTIWQGVSNKAFLYDWKINVDIAHNIYERDGSFKLWTCGRKLSI